MSQYQPGILAAPVPLQARHLFFALESLDALPAALDALVEWAERGPPGARIDECLIAPISADTALHDFAQRPTV